MRDSLAAETSGRRGSCRKGLANPAHRHPLPTHTHTEAVGGGTACPLRCRIHAGLRLSARMGAAGAEERAIGPGRQQRRALLRPFGPRAARPGRRAVRVVAFLASRKAKKISLLLARKEFTLVNVQRYHWIKAPPVRPGPSRPKLARTARPLRRHDVGTRTSPARPSRSLSPQVRSR